MDKASVGLSTLACRAQARTQRLCRRSGAQAVAVLVGGPLPGMVRFGKVHVDAGEVFEVRPPGHLASLVPGVSPCLGGGRPVGERPPYVSGHLGRHGATVTVEPGRDRSGSRPARSRPVSPRVRTNLSGAAGMMGAPLVGVLARTAGIMPVLTLRLVDLQPSTAAVTP